MAKSRLTGTAENPCSPSGCARWALARQEDPEAASYADVLAETRRHYQALGGDPADVNLAHVYNARYNLRKACGGPLTKEKLACYLDDPPPGNRRPRNGRNTEDPCSAAGCLRWALARQEDPEAASAAAVTMAARYRCRNLGGNLADVTAEELSRIRYKLRKAYGRPLTKEKLAHYLAGPPANGKAGPPPDPKAFPPAEVQTAAARRVPAGSVVAEVKARDVNLSALKAARLLVLASGGSFGRARDALDAFEDFEGGARSDYERFAQGN